MDHLDQAGFNVQASMTAILPMAHTVYTGDEDGRVVHPLARIQLQVFVADATLV